MGRKRTPAVDIHMVAKKAGVSIATVSRAMNGIASVDAKLAARVMKAAAELNYTPNTQARALVSGRSRMIGLIVSEITNPFFPELIQSFEDATVDRGYELLIGSTNYSPARMMQCVRRMVERKVEGVAVMTFGMDEDLLQELSDHGIMVVSTGPTKKLEHVASIEVDYRNGIQEAVQHLAVMGHREIAFVSGPLRVPAAKRRRDAFVAAMAQIGIKTSPALVIEGDHTMEGGFEAAEKLFSASRVPTGIVCSNDMTAIGVLHSASGHGLRVPEDVSIIGFDDIHMAQFTVPPLTTVRMSCSDLAKAALDALLQGRHGAENTKPKIVPTKLIVRQTSGYPRTKNMTAEASAKNTPRKTK